MARDPLVGTKVGSYEVVELIGAGGMGKVYKAVHPAIGSRVAIKVLTGDLHEEPRQLERFFDEARTVGVIGHENNVNVLDMAELRRRTSRFGP